MSNNNTTPFKDAPPACQETFPDSDSIDDKIKFFVYNNMKYSEGWQHGRETLDDIIGDLIQYRKGLATPEEYLANNWL